MDTNSIHKEGVTEKIQFLANAAKGQLAVMSDFYLKTNVSRPFMVLIEPTLRCPMACKFCDLPTDTAYPKEGEMSLSQWKRILSELREFSPLAQDVFISGGEPFLRPDMCDLLDHAHSIGIGTRMVTIGAFCTQKVCDRLLQSPMKWLKFSIHSADQRVHDRLVGRRVFEKAVSAIRYLRESGYSGKLGILTTVFRENVHHLDEIVYLAQRLGVDSVFFRPLFGNTRATRLFGVPAPKNPECVIDDHSAVVDAIGKLKDMKRQGFPIADTQQQLDLIVRQTLGKNEGLRGCHMMYESIYIRPNGDVEICGHMSLGTMGNVSHTSLKDVLTSESAYAARHAISRSCRCQGNAFVRKTVGEKVSVVFSVLQE